MLEMFYNDNIPEEQKQIVREMIRRGCDIKEIKKCTNLSEDDIEQVSEEHFDEYFGHQAYEIYREKYTKAVAERRKIVGEGIVLDAFRIGYLRGYKLVYQNIYFRLLNDLRAEYLKKEKSAEKDAKCQLLSIEELIALLAKSKNTNEHVESVANKDEKSE